jgi:PTS system glucose-specific IIC component
MARGSSAFAVLQKIGRSLMLPVSVLPIAGILLGVGSAHFSWLPRVVSDVMAQSGGAIFGNLALIFAIGVALGLTANDGVATLAAVVGYVVLLATMGVMAALLGYKPTAVMGIQSIETGVFGGIIVGGIAGWLFNRYYRVRLPAYLGFFAGKRSVPILTALACIAGGVILSFVWPPIGNAINAFSRWAASENPRLAFFLYGVVERALLPFGLHHIWNVPFFFEVGQYVDPATGAVIRGELYRYTAGDPTAGNMAGGYLFKMWGLPAAAIAMWHTARPENRAKVGGIMLSAALTSFLTGITEPIEFSFLFVAPLLYVIHAFLAGVAYYTCIALGIRHSMTFSHGFIDFVLLFNRSTHALWFLWLGPLWALMYYGLFRFMIERFDLKTPGRDIEAEAEAVPAAATTSQGLAKELVLAFGGATNIQSLDACITRLRVQLEQVGRANPARLKSLGAAGVVTIGNTLQAIFGTRSESLKGDIEAYLRTGETPIPSRVDALIAALGGRENIERVEVCAITRLRIVVKDATAVSDAALHDAGASGVMQLPNNTLHVIVGPNASAYAGEVQRALGVVRALAT